MRKTVRRALATLVAGSAVLAMGVPAARADRPRPHPGQAPSQAPSQAQVDAAKKTADQKAADVAALQADLVVATARLRDAAQRAEIAAETYNGAVWRLSEAAKASASARLASQQADGTVEAERAGIAQLVTQRVQDGTVLSGVTAYLGGEDPNGIMDRLGVANSANEAMEVRYDEYSRLAAEAEVAEARAAKAEKKQTALAKEAAALRDEAGAAANLAQSVAAGLAGKRRALIEELAKAQKITVALATRRQKALEKIAAQKAAAAAAAQAAAEAKKAAAKAKAEAKKAQKESDATDQELQALGEEGGWDLPGLPVPAGTSEGARRAIEFARAQLGEPYVWAAAGPDSWDCSGLTMMAWREGGVSLPHYSAAQYQQTQHLSAVQLKPGDLVFWGTSPNTIHHVALYIGSGQIIHAPRTGVPVKVSGMYDGDPPNYFGRP
ncbi:C40 family peptidase [Marmoricola sp. RAF53]|uniref:C40 family peptidase n=1 Tax=Marmoricola sp. RAF53 TaxID=3233059 RepID=UPI003F94B85A